ncbi:hypothetical protein F4782DRAFT_286682 [Xylaria castorea]|nr:hypothetical protein F4782DRAFT_286682 [Xylaria castorea]
MGGLAFASGPDPVFTPRMQPDVYRAVRDRCQEKLRELFVVVATPIEGPAKTSFGDIDLFVAWERKDVFPPLKPALFSPSPESPKEAIYRVLGAIKCKSENKNTATIAIPWPEDLPYTGDEAKFNGPENEKKDEKSPAKLKPLCIQVDIHVCPTLDYLQWMLFKHAHGDLWNLLGATIRPFGLTIDEVGLYVRIPEIEEIDKKKAKVLLSTDPAEILQFLCLKFNDKQWEEPFASDEDVFEYAATCSLFWAKVKETETSADNENASTLQSGGDEKSGAIGADKRKLKANDRRRMAYRPLFRKWVEEYLPACRASGRFTTTPPTREEVRQQTFEYFPGARSIYDARAAEWRVQHQHQTLWNGVIKPAVPEDLDDVSRRSCCTAALKKIIIHGDASFGDIVAPPTLRREDGLFDEDAVRAWVEDNWRAVLDVAWAINQQRYRESVKLKELKAAAAKRTVSGSEKPASTGIPAEAQA